MTPRERLQALSTFLRNEASLIAPNFNLNTWGAPSYTSGRDELACPLVELGAVNGRPSNGFLIGLELEHLINARNVGAECGTAACACGWAAACPALRQEGFALFTNNLGGEYEHPTSYSIQRNGMSPSYERFRGWEAVTAFFGISYDDALILFTSAYYKNLNPVRYDDKTCEPMNEDGTSWKLHHPSPTDVADRIDYYLAYGFPGKYNSDFIASLPGNLRPATPTPA